ncbi:rod shape-determining protein MreD [Paracoccus spongiarum]|uniref:Rod shape-determining protein MreD n=1 Tax=Paracoccus spongiarum TaxID=3064387 RepID=A0ABT9JAD6_9RHOB|nr:rod shape-determining protein MreD [Paracoccus sp. 2205BS29-5]MDP5306768.1 rod shape-determining protein MreD [Paracoccus sp. 2205BS29-5]
MLLGTALFLLCMALLILLRLLPLSSGMTGWPGPDLGLALTFAWVLRRPDQIPALAIALAFLVEDLLLLRPIGLWAALMLLATEAARLREPRWRDQPFMVEWLRVAMLIGAMTLANRLVLLISLMPVPALGQVLLQYLATLAAYPPVVFAARWLIGLRRSGHGGADVTRQVR